MNITFTMKPGIFVQLLLLTLDWTDARREGRPRGGEAAKTEAGVRAPSTRAPGTKPATRTSHTGTEPWPSPWGGVPFLGDAGPFTWAASPGEAIHRRHGRSPRTHWAGGEQRLKSTDAPPTSGDGWRGGLCHGGRDGCINQKKGSICNI